MKILFILLICLNFPVTGQNRDVSFKKLSSPEKVWVFFHPFKAKRANIITKEVLRITDSISRIKALDQDINGGRLDAFKHSYWMARLSQEIGKKAALKLGKAHEKGNYRSFKKGEKEDKILPDFPSTKMDLFNNEIGSSIGVENSKTSKSELVNLVIFQIKKGDMKVLKKDKKGNFLSCVGQEIPRDSFIGKWENDKCLINSGQIN